MDRFLILRIYFYSRKVVELLSIAALAQQNQVKRLMNLFKPDDGLFFSFCFTVYFIDVCVCVD
jgi:hypothetical protein